MIMFAMRFFAHSIKIGVSFVCALLCNKSMLSLAVSAGAVCDIRHGIPVPSGISRTAPFM